MGTLEAATEKQLVYMPVTDFRNILLSLWAAGKITSDQSAVVSLPRELVSIIALLHLSF